MSSGEGAEDSIAKFTSLVRAMDYWTSLFTCPGKELSVRRNTYNITETSPYKSNPRFAPNI